MLRSKLDDAGTAGSVKANLKVLKSPYPKVPGLEDVRFTMAADMAEKSISYTHKNVLLNILKHGIIIAIRTRINALEVVFRIKIKLAFGQE